MSREFKNLNKIYPDEPISSKNYLIYKKKLSVDELEFFKKSKDEITPDYIDDFVLGEEYVCLLKKDEGELMMSTHPSETISNKHFINNAIGDVLIFGLGLGMIVFPLLNDKKIKSITIIEKDVGLIDIVGKFIYRHDLSNKVNIINDDAFNFHNNLKNNDEFDTIYFDIWIKINKESIVEMDRLHSLYNKHVNSNLGSITSWCYELKDGLQ